jgi:hypothetical protein
LYFTVGLDRLYKIQKKYRCIPNVISYILLSPVIWKVKMAEDDIAFLLNREELVELVNKTSIIFIRQVATKLQSAYVLVKGGRAYVSLSSLTR